MFLSKAREALNVERPVNAPGKPGLRHNDRMSLFFAGDSIPAIVAIFVSNTVSCQ